MGEEGREWAEPPGDFQLGAPSCGVPAVVFSLSVRFSEFECACEGCFCEHDRVLCIELDPLSRTLVSQVLFLNDQNSLSVFLRRGGKFSLFQRKGEIVFQKRTEGPKREGISAVCPGSFVCLPVPKVTHRTPTRRLGGNSSAVCLFASTRTHAATAENVAILLLPTVPCCVSPSAFQTGQITASRERYRTGCPLGLAHEFPEPAIWISAARSLCSTSSSISAMNRAE